jgi:hypothetical protein
MAAKAVLDLQETSPEHAKVVKSAIHDAAQDWTWENAIAAVDAINSMTGTMDYPLRGQEEQRKAEVWTGPLLADFHRPGQQPYWTGLESVHFQTFMPELTL